MKLIIENQSDLNLSDSIILIQRVVDMGKISNEGKQHCYVTTFSVHDKGYAVYSVLNKASERFIIINEPYF